MKRAKGPSSLHSPFSAPALDSPADVRFLEEVRVVVEVNAECPRVDAVTYDRVGEKTMSMISTGNEWAVGVGKATSSGDMILGRQAGRQGKREGKMDTQRQPSTTKEG